MTAAWRAYLVRFALVAALLVTWSMGIGRYGGPDEPAHVLRSYAAAHGDLLGDPADPLPPGFRFVSVPASLASGDPSCYRHDSASTSECARVDPAPGTAAGERMVRVGTSAGLTPPLYHVVVGTIVRAVGDPADTAWYRLVAAMLHAAVVALALTRMRHSAIGSTLVVAAITPATWFLLGVVNPNTFEIALALLAWVGVMRAVEAGALTTRDAWWIGGPAALAIAVRPVALVALLAMAVVVELRCRPGRRRWLLAAAPVAAVAAGLAWGAAVGVQVDDSRTAVRRSLADNVSEAVRSLPTTAAEAIGSLSWNELRAPGVASAGWALIVIVLPALSLWLPQRRQPSQASNSLLRHGARRAACAWVGVLIVVPVAFDVVMADSIGPVWQGRYSLPVVLGLMAVLMPSASRPSPVPTGVPATPIEPARRGNTRVVMAALIATGLIEIVTYWATVRRYAVGTDGSWWLTHHVDSTSLTSPRAWLLIHLVVVTIVVGLSVRAVLARADDDSRGPAHPVRTVDGASALGQTT